MRLPDGRPMMNVGVAEPGDGKRRMTMAPNYTEEADVGHRPLQFIRGRRVKDAALARDAQARVAQGARARLAKATCGSRA